MRRPRPRRAGPPPNAPCCSSRSTGFRADYIQRPAAVRLRALAASGVRAERMIPAFPSKTFPNHYTPVTGLRPSITGIVANSMWDDVIGRKFTISDTAVTHDPRWWGGEPLWGDGGDSGQTGGFVLLGR